MALSDQIKTYVDTATPQNDAQFRAQLASQLLNSGELYLSTDNVLCIRACSAAIGNIRTSTLPTRISSGAKSTLDSLRELANAGLLDKSALYDLAPGVTVEVIP